MYVLKLKKEEGVTLDLGDGRTVRLVVKELGGGHVRIGFEAPDSVYYELQKSDDGYVPRWAKE
jgi:sRNA-binding carbon storage regulator CsrA